MKKIHESNKLSRISENEENPKGNRERDLQTGIQREAEEEIAREDEIRRIERKAI